MSFSESIKKLGFSDLKDFSVREREILYSAAYGMYQIADYKKASGIFTKLVLHFPFEERFWKGLASTYQMQKLYREALHAWGAFSLLTNHDPKGHFHAAECFLSLGEIHEAKKALSCARHRLEKKDPLNNQIEQFERVINGY